MTSREKILGRIREALQARAPEPGGHGDHSVKAVGTDPEDLRHWLPPVGGSWEAQCDLFARNSEALKTEFKPVADVVQAGAELRQLAQSGQWRRVAGHRAPLVEQVLGSLGLETLWTDTGVPTADLEACDAGVSACEALVAQTGSVLVTSAGSGGRALSVLPPHHIVIARRDQLVPDLAAAFACVRERHGDRFPSMISFITGPSRTGDIERILVLGAHGPKRLTVFLVG